MKNRIFLTGALWLAAAAAMAQLGDANKTVIQADRLNYDYKRLTAVFEDHVHISDPRFKIDSDELRIIFSRTNEVRSVTAIGNVTLVTEDKTGTCRKAVYLTETEEVVLTGDARLTRGKDTVTGDRITFYLNEDRVVVEGGTQLVIVPEGNPKRKPKR